MNPFFKTLTSLLIVMLFTTCKKYPENNLWFKRPQKVAISGHLVAYTVNGTDSMSMWDEIYSDPSTSYNGYCNVLPSSGITITSLHSDRTGFIIDSPIGFGTLKFYNLKKYLHVNFNMGQTHCNPVIIPKYNLFLTTDGDWKILKLTRDGIIRLQRTYNDKVYEIEFK